jgi:hypothetical protein
VGRGNGLASVGDLVVPENLKPCVPAALFADFNPIEMLVAKLKTLLRKAAQRTIASLWNAIGRLLDDFSGAECSRYLAHAGYRST